MNWLISDPIQDYLSCWVQSILRYSCWDVIHVNGMELKLTDKLPFICWQVYNARIEVAGGPWEIWGISRSGSNWDRIWPRGEQTPEISQFTRCPSWSICICISHTYFTSAVLFDNLTPASEMNRKRFPSKARKRKLASRKDYLEWWHKQPIQEPTDIKIGNAETSFTSLKTFTQPSIYFYSYIQPHSESTQKTSSQSSIDAIATQ